MKKLAAPLLAVITATFLLTACADQNEGKNDIKDMQDATLNESPTAPQDGTSIENDTFPPGSRPDPGPKD